MSPDELRHNWANEQEERLSFVALQSDYKPFDELEPKSILQQLISMQATIDEMNQNRLTRAKQIFEAEHDFRQDTEDN
jgi:hypothetical protein